MRVRSLLALFCFGFLAAGQTPRPGLSAELPVYAHDYHSTGFSPLAEITPKNVAGLRQICSYPLPEKTTFESSLIFVGGTLYSTTSKYTYALGAPNAAGRNGACATN